MIKTHLFSIFDFIDFQEMAVAASSANEDRAAMVRQKEEIRSLKEEKERNAQLEMKRVGFVMIVRYFPFVQCVHSTCIINC